MGRGPAFDKTVKNREGTYRNPEKQRRNIQKSKKSINGKGNN